MIRTDIPLDPVPFAERMDSDLWESLTPRPRLSFGANRKLTETQVREIRRRYRPHEFGAYRLAREYGVCRDVIYCVLKGTTYKEIA